MRYLLLLALGLMLAGCATTRDDDNPRVNTMPWNRPESHEGMGPLGFLNTR